MFESHEAGIHSASFTNSSDHETLACVLVQLLQLAHKMTSTGNETFSYTIVNCIHDMQEHFRMQLRQQGKELSDIFIPSVKIDTILHLLDIDPNWRVPKHLDQLDELLKNYAP